MIAATYEQSSAKPLKIRARDIEFLHSPSKTKQPPSRRLERMPL
jgi:hypothetical protein